MNKTHYIAQFEREGSETVWIRDFDGTVQLAWDEQSARQYGEEELENLKQLAGVLNTMQKLFGKEGEYVIYKITTTKETVMENEGE